MKEQYNLDSDALFKACKEVAGQTLWQTPNPQDISDIIDSDQINKAIKGYFEEALHYVEFIVGQNRDPNLITRAILYLSQAHAIPPMKDDLTWFHYSLDVLIELACPNTIHPKETSQFLYDIEEGIIETRKNIYDI
ncbi:MAG: hypothetical protein M1479_08730 [Actinobacteria bacterium]|nr:hypothetical protein [Actinomycetota bacterium]